jgi:hypothetical protein
MGTIHNSRIGQPFRFSECSILKIRIGTLLRVPRESIWFILEVCAMNKRNPGPSPTPDWGAKTVEAILEAQSLPPGSERIEALKKADRLRNAADVYRYVFSTELRPPE